MKNYFTKFSALLVVMLFGLSMTAQRTVTGVVTDAENNEPLIGANVIVKGTSNGTITDIDGAFSVKVPDGIDVIIFSYTGYIDQAIVLGASNTLNVSLAPGALLDEVVVIGYGAVKKRDVTGSVASLKEADFNQGVITSPDQLLQSRVAGVNITNNSGQPGGQATVKIRGNNSIRAGANPLYVIDGVPLDGRTAQAGLLSTDIGAIAQSNPLNFINAADIASIDVLKDASSSAIYGARASNGVILITTKKARNGEPSVNFNTSVGTSSILKKYDVLDGNGYRDALSRYNSAATAGEEPFLNDDGSLKGDGGGNVDAMDAILRNGTAQNYNLSVGTGGSNYNVRFSGGYQDIKGIVKESGIKRYLASLNSNFTLLDGKAGMDAFLIASHTLEDIAPISTNAGFTGNLVGQALQWNPTVPLMTDGEFTTSINNPLVGNTTINPLQLLAAHKEQAKVNTVLANLSPYVNITDNLQYRYRLGLNYGVGVSRGGISGDVNVQGIEGEGLAGISNTELLTNLHTHTLNYTQDINDNISFGALVGYEYQKFDYKGYALAGRGFTVQDFDNTNAVQNSQNANKRFFSFADPISELQSYFGRVNMNISDKYLITATVRADGSSKFGENNKYGVFPSIGVAWNLINEDFLSGSELFDDLKVRVGYGVTGNQEFPSGAAQQRYGLTENGGTLLENVANPDLKWESSNTFNVGLDFGMFDYALTGTIEYYNRKTNDLLLDPFVSEPGPSVKAWRNIDGSIVNNGLEIALNSFLVNKENLTVNVGANVSFLNNEFVDYTGAPILAGDLFGQGSTGAFVQRMQAGSALNTFYVREHNGIGADGLSSFTAEGEEFYEKGDPNADIVLGFNAGFTANALSFNMNWNGAFGHQLYNNTAMSVISIGNLGNRNIDAALMDGDVLESPSNPITSSSRYLENGDFLKLANATLSYNLGDISKLKDVRLSLTGQNLLVLTNYTGFDPEVNTVNLRSGVPSSGIEYIPYPSARTFLVGLNVSF